MAAPARGSAKGTRWVVLDTAAILAGMAPATGPGLRAASPSAVFDEVRPGGPTGRALERAVAQGLERRDPGPDDMARVREAASATGDLARLSAADLAVLGLAWMLGRLEADTAAAPDPGPVPSDPPAVVVWSDDYAVLNVARRLGLGAETVTKRGGHEDHEWHVRCTGCGRFLETAPKGDECPVCGSPTKLTRRAPPGGSRSRRPSR